MKKWRMVLWLCALLMCTLPACAQEAAQRMEDIAALCGVLEEKHPDPYAHISREAFNGKRAEIEARAQEMTDGEFAYALMELAASIGDAHTTVSYYQNKYSELTALPFALMPMEGRWLLAMAQEEHAAYLGWEVGAINGVPMTEVFERAKAYISHDTLAWARRQLSNTINFLEALKVMGIVPEHASGAKLSLTGPLDEVHEVYVPGMNESEIMQAKIVSLTPAAYAQTWASGYYRAMPLNDSVFFIQYNVCQEAPDMSMEAFSQLVRPNVEAAQKVIIDLRYNTGGDSRVIEPLLNMLEYVRAQRPLDVYTLIAGDTFSSGVMNALDTKMRLDAVLVGSPTGGAVNAFGELYTQVLPHAPMAVSCSTKRFELQPDYAGDSLIPDIHVEQTLADYLCGRDSVVEAVLAL